MKKRFIAWIIPIFLISCEKEKILPEQNTPVSFAVSERLYSGKSISSIDFDQEGTAWLGSGNELMEYKNDQTTIHDIGYTIMDISAGYDGTIWVATKENGLACFDNREITFFTVENSGLPRNAILDVEAAPDGTVWFSSSAHQLGGLMHFDGHHFELYTPENSILNQHLVLGLKVSEQNDLFCFTEGTVSKAKIFHRDSRGNWSAIEESFYWIASMDLTSKSEPVVLTDHSLSSCYGCYTDHVAVYKKGKWEIIDIEFLPNLIAPLLVDQRDYIWTQGWMLSGPTRPICVYNGEEWFYSGEGELAGVYVNSLAADPDNNIWLCTNQGIFILNQ
jgi:ligand-binding sensor domain-containing protein